MRATDYFSEAKRLSRATNFSVRQRCREISIVINRKCCKAKPVSKTTDYFNFCLLPNPKMVLTRYHITAFFEDGKQMGIANRTRLFLQ